MSHPWSNIRHMSPTSSGQIIVVAVMAAAIISLVIDVAILIFIVQWCIDLADAILSITNNMAV